MKLFGYTHTILLILLLLNGYIIEKGKLCNAITKKTLIKVNNKFKNIKTIYKYY